MKKYWKNKGKCYFKFKKEQIN